MPGRLSLRRGGVKSTQTEHRINFLVAMVFLLAAAIGLKLFYLQIFQHNYYLAEAAGLHNSIAKLAPDRGKIYLIDRAKGDELYPLATNKEYISIFAAPKDLVDKNQVIDKLYQFFQAKIIEQETDKLLNQQEAADLATELKADPSQAEQIQTRHRRQLADPIYQNARQLKKQAMIEAKKQAYYQELSVRLNRPNDPYELLAKKVEPDEAKRFHLSLLSDVWRYADLKIDDLSIDNNKMYQMTNGALAPVDYPGIGYQSETYRYYLDAGLACHVLGYVDNEPQNKDGVVGRRGHYGLEGFFDEELFGQYGAVQSEKGAGGVMIVLNRQTDAKKNGEDLVLTLDRSIQFFAAEEVKKAVKAYSADLASIIVMDPATGAIIAMASYPDFDPNNYNLVTDAKVLNNPAVFDAYEPGSVFKAITMAGALNEHKVTPETTYVDQGQIMIEGWNKPIKNSDFPAKGGHGVTTMTQVLEKSLNTGAIFAMRSMGKETFAGYAKSFGFGEKTGIELEGESKGSIANLTDKKIKEISAATAAFGQGISVTPIQMITAFTALANGGKLVKPNIVKEIRQPDGQIMTTPLTEPRQIISPEASALITGMLIKVVDTGNAYRGVRSPGYYIAGKTGTAQIAATGGYGVLYNHTFIGYGPADNPKFVVLVRVAKPRGFEYAESTAVPIAHEMIDFILKYWGIAKNR